MKTDNDAKNNEHMSAIPPMKTSNFSVLTKPHFMSNSCQKALFRMTEYGKLATFGNFAMLAPPAGIEPATKRLHLS